MEIYNEILRALGRIEGELVEIHKLSQPIGRLEISHAWLKGGWALLVSVWIFLFRVAAAS